MLAPTVGVAGGWQGGEGGKAGARSGHGGGGGARRGDNGGLDGTADARAAASKTSATLNNMVGDACHGRRRLHAHGREAIEGNCLEETDDQLADD